MSEESKVYQNDIGVKITLDTGDTDITGASVLKIKYKRPDGETGEWTALAEGTDKIYYITEANDLSKIGVWELQAYVEIGTFKGHGEIAEFKVYQPIEVS